MRGPERTRKAQKGTERPREPQRGSERHREAQRGPEKTREDQRGPEGAAGISRSISPVKRAKRYAGDRLDVDVHMDELSTMRIIGNKVRK
ncbi:hypothetical protein K0M31_012040 [Melipona bicolor]|uniref:Uncharacterized protein n=1 Tax=Melipona bicolor TaxID=60889 RepID=A0AA40KVA4_9HYME|nr:hypothetical protein K0M31_012040 [Melipona bicolor]